MDKIINQLFPFVDFLYILQLEEYDTKHYYKWTSTRFFTRGFQKVDSIKWTVKARIILAISLILYVIFIFILASAILNILWLILSLIIMSGIIPLIVLLAGYLFQPVDNYFKSKTVTRAKIKLEQLTNIRVIAIAGSYGKTSTRYFSQTLLSYKFRVHTPPENHNTLYSISDDILNNVDEKTEIYLVELGEYKIGDFKQFWNLLNPNYLIITAVGPQHLHSFGSQDKIDAEFSEMLSLASHIPVLANADNVGVRRIVQKTDVKINKYSTRNLDSIKSNNSLLNIAPQNQNIAAAVSLAKELGIGNKDIEKNIVNLEPTDRRFKTISNNHVTIIDDSYNINPDSARAAAENISKLKGRKIVVTGGIVDQGSREEIENVAYGKLLAQKVDIIIIANNILASFIERGAVEAKTNVKLLFSEHPSKTPDIIKENIQSGDTILIQNELPDTYWS